MCEPNQPVYPEELSRFLTAQAAQLDAQPVEQGQPRFDAVAKARMYEGTPIMPPEFELKPPRRVRWSTFATEPNCGWTHMCGVTNATPEQEAWHRINDPEGGLHPHDLTAYRKSQRRQIYG